VLVDFGLAQQAMTQGAGTLTKYQVWLTAGAPADMKARLAEQGVIVTSVVRAASFRTELDHTGPAFAGGLFLVAAAAAALLAIGATVLAGLTTARRRAYELAALEAAGVPARTLRRATAIEQGLMLGIGLVVGVVAGVGGSALALPSTPFFVDDTIGPPSQHGLPLALLGMLVGALAVVFVLTSWVVARLVSRQAGAARLREAQQ
jgi:ABC-type antimicrobial peptide transport system permease subunit